MIRIAQNCDTNQIKEIWENSFKDEDNFINYYFDNLYNTDNTLVYTTDDNKVVSTLQRLPYQIHDFGQVSYIFGACTDINYRSMGLMQKLLHYTHQLDIAENKMASILIPQEKSLFRYYSRFGYKPLFEISKNDYFEFSHNKMMMDSFYNVQQSDYDDIVKLYTDTVLDTHYVIRDKQYISTQVNMFKALSGDVFCVKRNNVLTGYAFIWNDTNPVIAEFNCKDKHAQISLINNILKFYKIDKITAVSFDNTNNQSFGCIKYYNDIIIEKPLKMNLMFN